MNQLTDTRVAILTENGFEQIELTMPKTTLELEGFTVHVISPKPGKIKAWNFTDWGIDVKVDVALADANPDDYAALILPGGVLNPDILRQNEEAVRFVKEFVESGKPVAAICHGPQMLIETGLLKGKTMTSYPAIKTDLKNAGANWVDDEVVHFENLITSRTPDDLDAFCDELIRTLSVED